MCHPDRLTLQFQEMVSQGTSGHPSPGTVSVLAYRAEAVCLEKWGEFLSLDWTSQTTLY